MLRPVNGFLILVFMAGSVTAWSANEPCSRGKGGVSHCEDGKFICKDGSVSGSTRTCSGYGSEAKPKAKPRANLTPRVGKDGSVRYGMPTQQELP